MPDDAAPFLVMAVRVPGPEDSSNGDAGPVAVSQEAVGRQLLSLVFGAQDVPGVLHELARDPGSRKAKRELHDLLYDAFEADPVLSGRVAEFIAAFYRRRADAGDVEALIELGHFLYWDKPVAALAAFREALEAGHLPAMINVAEVLRNVLEDKEAALAVYEQAAASGDADVSAEAMYEIAFIHKCGNDVAAARAQYQRVIDTGHPAWAAAAKISMAGLLARDDFEGQETLYREAIAEGDAERSSHASFLLGQLLERKGDAAGAKVIWQCLIDSGDPDGAAFGSLVNLLEDEEDADGLRAAYLSGVALGNPEALYALLHLGQLLEAHGDVDGAHQAWQQAIDAGCEDPGYWLERMSPAPELEPEPEVRVYPPELPPEFNPANMIRTGIDVLDRGLLPLPTALTDEMAIPISYWIAEQCAVVLVLRFSRHRHNETTPVVMQVTYSRDADGRWEPPAYIAGGSFSYDPIRNPGSMRDLGGYPMVYGSSSLADEATPGRPAVIATGRAAPEVTYVAVIKDGHEDRRPLESHFGAWVVCTEQPGPFEVTGLDANGAVLATLPYTSQPPGDADLATASAVSPRNREGSGPRP